MDGNGRADCDMPGVTSLYGPFRNGHARKNQIHARSYHSLGIGPYERDTISTRLLCRGPALRAGIQIELQADAARLVHHGVPLGPAAQQFRRELDLDSRPCGDAFEDCRERLFARSANGKMM